MAAIRARGLHHRARQSPIKIEGMPLITKHHPLAAEANRPRLIKAWPRLSASVVMAPNGVGAAISARHINRRPTDEASY